MKAATLANAERACRILRQRFAGVDGVQGLGIAVLEGGYGVKLNVREGVPLDCPDDVDGVPIIVEVVGIITPW